MKKLSKETKIWLGFIILVLASWIFDFPSQIQENIYDVLFIMIAIALGGLWWLFSELKEVQKTLYKILNKE